jgi:hypothetical protein
MPEPKSPPPPPAAADPSAPGTPRCSTCYGRGTIFDDYGPKNCPDCSGLGELPSAGALTERRLRELEQRYTTRDEETRRDMRWLTAEVRRAHQTLFKILAASQETASSDPIARGIGFLANDILGVYAPSTESQPGGGTSSQRGPRSRL